MLPYFKPESDLTNAFRAGLDQHKAHHGALPVYIMSDQPERCAKCGVRTEFSELGGGRQVHTCLNSACRYRFILEEG